MSAGGPAEKASEEQLEAFRGAAKEVLQQLTGKSSSERVDIENKLVLVVRRNKNPRGGKLKDETTWKGVGFHGFVWSNWKDGQPPVWLGVWPQIYRYIIAKHKLVCGGKEFPLMDECQTVKLSESMPTPLLGKYGKSKPLITVHRLLSKVLAIQGDAGRMALNVLVEDIFADLSELTQEELERVSEKCHDRYCVKFALGLPHSDARWAKYQTPPPNAGKAEDAANAAEPSDRSGAEGEGKKPSGKRPRSEALEAAGKLKLGVNIKRPHADASPDVVSGSEGETTESEGEASSDGQSATSAEKEDEDVGKADSKHTPLVAGPNFPRPKRNAEGEFKHAVSHGTVLAADVSKALAGEESIFDGLGTSPCVGADFTLPLTDVEGTDDGTDKAIRSEGEAPGEQHGRGMGKFIPEGKDVGVSAVHEEMVQAYEAYTTKMSGCMDAMRGAIDQGVTGMPRVVDEEGVVREELIEAALNALSRTVKQEDMAKFITAVLSAAVAMQQKLR
ncbi:hypothetical protein WJX74_011055 [Apatococcus lobatus]|uniref:Uncharacterized protein n=1 Tax=Apatococcus lobatus TaxID=904363 RepID=A0AAW1QZG9_9CHLO